VKVPPGACGETPRKPGNVSVTSTSLPSGLTAPTETVTISVHVSTIPIDGGVKLIAGGSRM
jgi:hypothetical protein